MNCGINIVAARTTHQNEELKDASRKFNRVYAFRVSRVNADYVCLKLWLLGGVIRARNIAVAALPDLIAQIDAALADGCEVIALDGAEFSAPEKVLSGIRNEFSHCCLGASDANHVHGAGKAALPQSESLRSTKQKASAPQGSASAARQIYNEERKTKNEEPGSTPAGEPESCGGSRGKNGKTTVKECCSCGDDNNAAIHSSFFVLNSAFPRTKRGRTSVVVGVRKVAKFQPKTKGK